MNPETDKSAEDVSGTAPRSKPQKIKLPPFLWVSLALLALLIGMFAWKQIAVGAAERRLAEERQALIAKTELERVAIHRTAQETLARHSEDVHRLFGTALAWNVRSAMMRNNLDEIDQYFSALVKNERIQLVLLANPEGKVLLASDRKFMDTQVSEHFPPALLQQTGVTIHPGEGKERRMVLSIQGLNTQLGTVLLAYVAP